MAPGQRWRRNSYSHATPPLLSNLPLREIENGSPRSERLPHSPADSGSIVTTPSRATPSEDNDFDFRRSSTSYCTHSLHRISTAYIPAPVVQMYETATRWVLGSQPYKAHRIEPFFRIFQRLPLWIVNTWLPNRQRKFWALSAFCLIWFWSFISILRGSNAVGEVEGYGSVVRLSCISRLWSVVTWLGY